MLGFFWKRKNANVNRMLDAIVRSRTRGMSCEGMSGGCQGNSPRNRSAGTIQVLGRILRMPPAFSAGARRQEAPCNVPDYERYCYPELRRSPVLTVEEKHEYCPEAVLEHAERDQEGICVTLDALREYWESEKDVERGSRDEYGLGAGE